MRGDLVLDRNARGCAVFAIRAALVRLRLEELHMCTAGRAEGVGAFVIASSLKDQPRVLVCCFLRGERRPFDPSAAIQHRVRVVEV